MCIIIFIFIIFLTHTLLFKFFYKYKINFFNDPDSYQPMQVV